VSVDSSERKGNRTSRNADLSDDGRFVVFESFATNLVPNDTNRMSDVFVRDRTTGTTSRVSVATGGRQGDSHSGSPVISGNGRYVAFVSSASRLVAGDTNGASDVFVRDLRTGTTERVDVGPGGQARSGGGDLGISADGRYVLFTMYANSTATDSAVWVRDRVRRTTTSLRSQFKEPRALALSRNGRFAVFLSASALVRGDTNGKQDVFVRDLVKGVTERVSVSSSEGQANGTMAPSTGASISDDGRFVVFGSRATNLVAGDTNGFEDVFLRDRSKGTTVRVLPGTGAAQPNNTTTDPVLDGTGRYVVLANAATNVGPRAGVILRDRGGL
jgi:Tol biopolymer transport system component